MNVRRRFATLAVAISLFVCVKSALGAGSIAYSSSTRASGAAANYPKQSDADAAAISDCGDSTCTVVAQFTDSCGALAVNSSSHASAADTRETAAKARQSALAQCTSQGGTCVIVIARCDGSAYASFQRDLTRAASSWSPAESSAPYREKTAASFSLTSFQQEKAAAPTAAETLEWLKNNVVTEQSDDFHYELNVGGISTVYANWSPQLAWYHSVQTVNFAQVKSMSYSSTSGTITLKGGVSTHTWRVISSGQVLDESFKEDQYFEFSVVVDRSANISRIFRAVKALVLMNGAKLSDESLY